MISIEARKHFGNNWFMIREWDGYDRPHHYHIFKITDDEIDFEGGRFKYFKQGKSEHKIVIPNDSNVVKLEEVIDWIGENIKNTWSFDISDDIEDTVLCSKFYLSVWVFYFYAAEDTMAFILRWTELDK